MRTFDEQALSETNSIWESINVIFADVVRNKAIEPENKLSIRGKLLALVLLMTNREIRIWIIEQPTLWG